MFSFSVASVSVSEGKKTSGNAFCNLEQDVFDAEELYTRNRLYEDTSHGCFLMISFLRCSLLEI